MAGAGSGRTGAGESRAESCTGPGVHGQERRNCHGPDGGGICGGRDADRQGGGGGCELSEVLPGDGRAGGEGERGVRGMGGSLFYTENILQ